ncbi:MAG: SDR family NAD(P)-dependent oxidoreductase, partial [Pseudomonadota bacterium]|nr:SDR family NAD(P)-dependent oxidoreductase [Pseudomonadota bacterium]
MSEGKLLDGKTALITGAGRGIGRDMAIMMAANGAKVIVNDLGGTTSGEGADQEPALEVVKEIRDAGGEAEANFGSVADFATGEAMVAQAIDQFGGLDIVVNNAGILRDVIFHKMTEEEWDAVINVHLKGAFNVSRAAATHFREKGSGCFVHFTSTSGLIGNFGQANYAAAKLGIAGLSKSIALDMARFGVTSNCISPFAWSRMIGTIPIGDEAQRARVDKLKAMTPAKIAPLAVALASEAGKQVSGQIFAVRNNEIFLMGQSRPVRSVHTAEGWT